MSELTNPTQVNWSESDLAVRFGSIAIDRVCRNPGPGTATAADVVRLYQQSKRFYELVDGTLVEKTVGTYESYIAAVLVRLLGAYVADKDLGIVLGADGMLQLGPGLVRIPDVSFIAWSRLPNRCIPDQAIAELVPDLAVEVISRHNTAVEMERKLAEYFHHGVQLVWYVYPEAREVHVYTAVDECQVVTAQDQLTGAAVLPGFSTPVGKIFR